MPYVAVNLSEKIEMSQFDTEAEARAFCRKRYYPYHIIFEGTISDAVEDKVTTPVAIYALGQAFNCTPLTGKDVPYQTYRVIEERLPKAEGFEAIIINLEDRVNWHEHRERIDTAFDRGVQLLWIIYADSMHIEVGTAANRRERHLPGPDSIVDGGDVVPGYSIRVRDLFREVEVE